MIVSGPGNSPTLVQKQNENQLMYQAVMESCIVEAAPNSRFPSMQPRIGLENGREREYNIVHKLVGSEYELEIIL